jgi:hypothetical protein
LIPWLAFVPRALPMQRAAQVLVPRLAGLLARLALKMRWKALAMAASLLWAESEWKFLASRIW